MNNFGHRSASSRRTKLATCAGQFPQQNGPPAIFNTALMKSGRRSRCLFAEGKMRNAVPESRLRRAQRDINRYRRLMDANHRAPETSAPTGQCPILSASGATRGGPNRVSPNGSQQPGDLYTALIESGPILSRIHTRQ